MPNDKPQRLTANQILARRRLVLRIARGLGFIGRIRYAHAYSRSGGATFAVGSIVDEDELTVFAEAFDRDRDPLDFSLDAIIAHERGHQLLLRHPRISGLMGDWLSLGSEEIIASILGAIISRSRRDRANLFEKAVAELVPYVGSRPIASARVARLRETLEKYL